MEGGARRIRVPRWVETSTIRAIALDEAPGEGGRADPDHERREREPHGPSVWPRASSKVSPGPWHVAHASTPVLASVFVLA